MKIEDFSPRMQKLIRWINKVETRLENRAGARRRPVAGGLPPLQFVELPAEPDHMKLDWGMGRSSIHPAVQRSDPGWNDQFGA